VLDNGADGAAGIRRRAEAALRNKPTVRVGRRTTRLIGALLAPEIHRSIARLLRIAGVRSILPPQRRLYSSGSSATSIGKKHLKLALARTAVQPALTWRLTSGP